jgi:hypothetical protein
VPPRRRACGHRVVTTPRVRPARAPRSRVAGHLLGWTGLPGRGPAGLSVDRVWQVTTPCTVAPGQFPAQYCARDLNAFPFVLNNRKQFKLSKFVECSKWANKILLDSSWVALHSGFDETLTCAVIYCIKFQ